ncbi:MAG TPA: hypothetical protein VNC50_13310, partial [Planctomycetia bacterium]|nr:hypothetical protein [Planctomycetia bacterium]
MYARDLRLGRRRDGVVLLIVLALLGLFAAVAVSFVVLAKSAGQGALNWRRGVEVIPGGGGGPGSETLLTHALNQLTYGTTNIRSAIRGHSLLEDMYGRPSRPLIGRDPTLTPPNDLRYFATDTGSEMRVRRDGSTHPYYGAFNGTGIFLPRDYGDPSVPTNVPKGFLSPFDKASHLVRLIPPPEFNAATGTYPVGFGGFTFAVGAGASVTGAWTSGFPDRVYFPFLPYNYAVWDQAGTRPATPQIGPAAALEYPSPERYWDTTDLVWRWFASDEDYDAADHNNMF